MDQDSFESKVLTSLAKIDEKLKLLPDHENRLRKLERYAYMLAGAWGVLSTWLGVHIVGHK